MRLTYLLMAAVSTLSGHHVPVASAVCSNVAVTGAMTLGFVHIVGADKSVSDRSRFLRDGNIAEGDKEERGWSVADIAEKLMAKIFVNKLIRSQSFSALEKVDPKKLDGYLAAADEHMISVFKFADEAKMTPTNLAKVLKQMPEADDAIAAKTVEAYTGYLKGLGKVN